MRRLPLPCVSIILFLVPTAATGDLPPEPPSPEQIETWLDALADDSWERREEATARLREHALQEVPGVIDALERKVDEAGPEARLRARHILAAVRLLRQVRTLRGEIEHEMELLHVAGISTEPAEHAPPEVPEEDNGASHYLDAWREYDGSGLGNRWREEPAWNLLLGKIAPYTLEERDRLREWLTPHEGIWEGIRDAQSRPAVRFDVDYGDGATASLVHTRPLRSLQEYLNARAAWQAAEGDVEDLGRTLEAQWRIVVDAARGPTLMEHLVAVAAGGIAMETLQFRIRNVDDASSLERILDALRRYDPYEGLVRSSRFEVAIGLTAYTMIEKQRDAGLTVMEILREYLNGMENPAFGWGELHEQEDLFFEFVRLRHLQVQRHLRDAVASEPHEPRRAEQMAQARAAIEKDEPLAPGTPAPALLIEPLVGVTERILRLTDRFEARRRAAACALALRIHRLRHDGADPADPGAYCRETLGEDLVRDPYTGDDLIFDLTPDKILVYSLGPNGTDESGRYDCLEAERWDLPLRWDLPFVIGEIPPTIRLREGDPPPSERPAGE